ncbi:hypothetical protein [Azospirillum thermophilum]|uniref:hypothetical protein n=1 Tax=Azospirillum thermophilum TaxID=2202148 RepID=UPI001FE2C4D6
MVIRKGAVDAVLAHVREAGRRPATAERELQAVAERVAKSGGTPLRWRRTAGCSASST